MVWVLVFMLNIERYLFFRDILACDLKMKTYKRKFSLLLHVEEMQMEVDIRKYDMENVTITKCKQNQHLLVLQVSGDWF